MTQSVQLRAQEKRRRQEATARLHQDREKMRLAGISVETAARLLEPQEREEAQAQAEADEAIALVEQRERWADEAERRQRDLAAFNQMVNEAEKALKEAVYAFARTLLANRDQELVSPSGEFRSRAGWSGSVCARALADAKRELGWIDLPAALKSIADDSLWV